MHGISCRAVGGGGRGAGGHGAFLPGAGPDSRTPAQGARGHLRRGAPGSDPADPLAPRAGRQPGTDPEGDGGRRVSESSIERIESYIEDRIKGRENFHKIMVIEAVPAGEIDRQLNILLIDDEKTICNVLKRFLESKGHKVTTSLE